MDCARDSTLIGAFHAAPPWRRRRLRWLVAVLLAGIAEVNDGYSVVVLVIALSHR